MASVSFRSSRTPFLRVIRHNHPSRLVSRTNTTVTTPKQVSPPAVSSAPPASSYIRGTRKPIGGFRGGITGFLLGTSIAAAYGYYHLLTSLAEQTEILNGAIADLQSSTTALETYIAKIETLEKDFQKLEGKVVIKDGLEGVRGEFKKAVAAVRGEGLELKERLIGLEKDVSTLTKNARSSLQPQS